MKLVVVNGVGTVSKEHVIEIYKKLVPSKWLLVELLAKQGYRFAANNNRYMHHTTKWEPYDIVLIANSSRIPHRYLWGLLPKEVEYDEAV